MPFTEHLPNAWHFPHPSTQQPWEGGVTFIVQVRKHSEKEGDSFSSEGLSWDLNPGFWVLASPPLGTLCP